MKYTVAMTEGLFDGVNPTLETACGLDDGASKRRLFVVDMSFYSLWSDRIVSHCVAWALSR